jgi:hypothetical protein
MSSISRSPEAPDLEGDVSSVLVSAHTTLELGTVLGELGRIPEVLATLKDCGRWRTYAPYDDRALDGTNRAAGILFTRLENAADKQMVQHGVCVIAGHAEVRADLLLWCEGTDVARGLAQLAERSITVRD